MASLKRLCSPPLPSVERFLLPFRHILSLIFKSTILTSIYQITYDLTTQVSPSDLPALRTQILLLLKHFAPGPKPIRVQLCVCLAILAIQMKDWDNVLSSVVQSLSETPESHACILDFLRVLPEEVTEGRKITLSVRGSRKENLVDLEPSFSRRHIPSPGCRQHILRPESNCWNIGRRAFGTDSSPIGRQHGAGGTASCHLLTIFTYVSPSLCSPQF